MPQIRFNHVFAGLLLLSLVSAFVLPKKTSGVRAHVQGIFYPVAKSARIIASTLRGRIDGPTDNRPATDVVAENRRLKVALAGLTGQMDHLLGQIAEYERFGDVAQFCKRVPVMGNDPAARDSLSVPGTFDATLLNQPVLYIGGLAGRFERAGLTGAQVRLVTDRSFIATGRFGTYKDNGLGGLAFFPIETRPPIVEGNGGGVMMIKNLEFKDVADAGIGEGTFVVLDDREFPSILEGRTLGRVVSVRKRPEAPLRADIEVRPEWNLMALEYVMVLTKPKEQPPLTRAE